MQGKPHATGPEALLKHPLRKDAHENIKLLQSARVNPCGVRVLQHALVKCWVNI